MRFFASSVASLGVFLGIMYLVWSWFLPFVLPFALAVFLAIIIDPAVDYIEYRWKIPRGGAVWLTLTLLVTAMALFVLGLVGVVRIELEGMMENMPGYSTRVKGTLIELSQSLGTILSQLPPGAQQALNDQIDAVYRSLNIWAAEALGAISALRALPEALINVIITVVATFFFSRDKRAIGRFVLSLLPPAWQGKVNSAKADVFVASVGFVKAQLAVMAVSTALTVTVLNLLGSRYSLTVGLLVGALDVFPVLGPGLVFIPWAMVEILGGDRAFGLWLLVFYAALAGVRQVIEPKVVGDRIGLHPLATLLALYLGLQVFGAPGVVFGPLTVIILKAMIRSGLIPLFSYDKS